MAPKDMPPDEGTDKKSSPETEPEPRKRRKHGYRGYPNKPAGGGVHIGSGFAGVGSTSGGSSGSDIITEKTRESVEELGEEDEEK